VSPFSRSPEGVRVSVQVQPGASRTAVEGPRELADGAAALKVRVGAPPEGGKANAQLVKLLAKSWRVPKTSIRVLTGPAERRKTLLVVGDPDRLLGQLAAWLKDLPGPSDR
jgi:uncharacterized protein (TIGR00251 family)